MNPTILSIGHTESDDGTLNVAHSRFVARSPQAIMNSYGRGHPHSGGAEIAETPTETGLDTGSNGRTARAGSELPGGCRAGKKKYLNR